MRGYNTCYVVQYTAAYITSHKKNCAFLSAHILTACKDHISLGVRLSTVVGERGTFLGAARHVVIGGVVDEW
jgi:hypothetical protein